MSDKNAALTARYAFVAIERNTSRGIEQVVDATDTNTRIGITLANWARAGYDIRYMDVDVAGLVPHV